jgi:HEAT repeat protein
VGSIPPRDPDEAEAADEAFFNTLTLASTSVKDQRPAEQVQDVSVTNAGITLMGVARHHGGIGFDHDESADRQDRIALVRLRATIESAFVKVVRKAAGARHRLSPLQSHKVAKLLATPLKSQDEICSRLEDLGRTASPAVIETLSGFAGKTQKEIRRAVAAGLGHIHHPDASAVLLRLLGDRAMIVAEAAARSLVACGEPETHLAVLASTLTSSLMNTTVITALESLSSEQKSVWETSLRSADLDNDPALLAVALRLLHKIGAEDYNRLVTHVGHADSQVRAAALDALIRTGNRRAVSLLNQAMTDRAAEVRRQAAVSARDLHSPRTLELLKLLLEDTDSVVRLQAAITAGRLHNNGLEESLSARLCQEADPEVLDAVVAALATKCPESAIPVLTRFADDPQSALRIKAARAIRKSKNPACLPLFLKLLEDPDPVLRRLALEYLGFIKLKGHAHSIEQMLRTDTSEQVRAACAKALGEIRTPRSLAALERALDDAPPVRLQAVIAMFQFNQPLVAPSLMNLLRDGQPEIRYQVVRGLGQLKLVEAAAAIEELLEDPDDLVRRGAMQALEEMNLSQSGNRFRRLIRWIGRRTVPAMPTTLRNALPQFALLAAVLLVLAGVGLAFLYSNNRAKQTQSVTIIGTVRTIALDSVSKQLLVLRIAGVLDVWDLESAKLQKRVTLNMSPSFICFDRRNSIVLVSGREIAQLTVEGLSAPESGRRVSLPGVPIRTFYHAPSDSLCVVLSEGNGSRLLRYDCTELKLVSEYPLSQPLTGRCTVTADFRLAAFVNLQGGVTVFDLVSGKSSVIGQDKLLPRQDTGQIQHIVFREDMKCLAISSAATGIVLFEMPGLKPIKQIPPQETMPFSDVAFSDNNLVAVCETGNFVKCSSDYKSVESGRINDVPQLNQIRIGGKGDLLVVASNEESNVWIVSLAEQRVLKTLKAE